MKEQDDTCTFKTYKNLLILARNKANSESLTLKMIINAGLISMLNKTKTEMENILKKAESGGEI